ncbi:hypothetical protein [Hymenobacter sp. DG25A]|uniref:hypothetical protein n=1 Tax=Hymenobacter sp. DG25A TaxID=1385663 RepID=UPI000B10C150|nr:hypothetical protein [Hymenobacter sp. DG25A]
MPALRYLTLLASLAILPFQKGVAQTTEQIAQAPGKKATGARLLVGGALSIGGDRVAEVYFTNGNTQSVKAGQGISFAVGGEFQLPKVEKLLLRATVGYKYVTTAAENAHIRLTRVPIDVTANWMVSNRIRIGAGLAMHRSIQFKADGIGEDMKFKGANGPIFEVAYRGVGLQYTAMKYTDQQNHSYAANSIGLAFTAVIPRR